MPTNLINIIGQLLGSGDTLSKIASLVGLTPDRAQSTIGAAAPAILAGLLGVGQQPSGRDKLVAAVRDQDPSLLDNLGAMLGGGKEKSLIETGTGLLGSLLGQSSLGTLTGAIGKFAGLNQGSSSSLLGLLAPVVLGAIGREEKKQGLDADGLMRMLNDQKDSIANALPADLAKELEPSGLLSSVSDRLGATADTVARAGSGTAQAVREQASGSGGMLRWIIGLAILAVILWAAYQVLMGGKAKDAVEHATDAATQISESAKNLLVGDVNVGNEVNGVLDSVTNAFNGITDAASAEAALPTLNEATASLDRLGSVAAQLPAEGRNALAAMINSAMPQLESLAAKAMDLPGVGGVIKPTVDALMAQLRALAG
jgi:hypothetical protein